MFAFANKDGGMRCLRKRGRKEKKREKKDKVFELDPEG